MVLTQQPLGRPAPPPPAPALSGSFPLTVPIWVTLKGHRTPLNPVYLIHQALLSLSVTLQVPPLKLLGLSAPPDIEEAKAFEDFFFFPHLGLYWVFPLRSPNPLPLPSVKARGRQPVSLKAPGPLSLIQVPQISFLSFLVPERQASSHRLP